MKAEQEGKNFGQKEEGFEQETSKEENC